MKFLMINIGSSSKKYGVFADDQLVLQATYSQTPQGALLELQQGAQSTTTDMSMQTYRESLSALKDRAGQEVNTLDAIGIRIVAPGTYFSQTRIIDTVFIDKLKEVEQWAPLHITPVLEEIAACSQLFADVPLIGVSDSEFHRTLPSYARMYAVPLELTRTYDVYRFGYHGISVQSVLQKLECMMPTLPSRIIVCHLGSGCSVTAVSDGISIDTSMGFTPTEGIPMAKRVGAIDPLAALYIAQMQNLSYQELAALLSEQSGWLGVSGQTADARQLLHLKQEGNQNAALALDLFIYATRKYIGAYAVALAGLDALIFTGAIGEGSAYIRSRICNGLEFLGITIDHELNEHMVNNEGLINSTSSLVKILVAKTDEHEGMMRLVKNFLY